MTRLDAALAIRGLARSRTHAATLIADGLVRVDGRTIVKASTAVSDEAAIAVAGSDHYVSRAAHKLIAALDGFGVDVAGRTCLDLGASTGGFTDVLLRAGAASVVAVDVGYGQLDWRLQSDPRVEVLDRTNVRTLAPEAVAPAPAVVVSDLSFISLTLVLPALVRCAAPDADYLLMVKPQFEVGRDRLGKGGVVRDPSLHHEAVRGVATCAIGLGLTVWQVAPSPLPGPAGNVEYFLAMSGGGRSAHPALAGEELSGRIRAAIDAGPKKVGA